MKKILAILFSACCCYSQAEDCTFDADTADSSTFTHKLGECDTLQQQQSQRDTTQADQSVVRLYGDGTVDPATGIAERPVVAPGSLNHAPGTVYGAREGYSLRPNATFEQSVTLAIHRLHSQMAHYCAKGWIKEKEWAEPVEKQPGDFYLHFQFRCIDQGE